MWLEGFNTTVHPAARAGASFHAAIRNGKFQGIICPTTPIGSLNIRFNVFSSSIFEVPSSLLIAPAKYLKWSAPNGISANEVSLIGFPLSILSTAAKKSLFLSIISAIFNNTSWRSIGDVFFQLSNAFSAAFTAASTSSAVASDIAANSSPVEGLYAFNVPPSEEGTHFPSINKSYFFCNSTAI